MDATKKMYIDQILQRNAMCDNSDTYWELMQSEIYGNSGSSTEWTREEMDKRRQANEVKQKRQQDLTYFDKLSQNIELYKDIKLPDAITKLQINQFPLLISNMDAILKSFWENKQPILELCLNSTFLTASECLVLAENPQFESLRSLDLSCNPITVKGLMYLVNPSHSRFSEKLSKMCLFNCEIDSSQTYLISNEQLQSSKCQFNLKYLNLSHNNLGNFLNYIVEFDMIN